MSWVWALATASKGQSDNTIVPSAGVVRTRTQSALRRCRREAVPVCSGASGCSGLVSDDVSCFPSTLPIVGNVSSP
jgi:hypothetical protein